MSKGSDIETFEDYLEDMNLLDEFTGLEEYENAARRDNNEFERFYDEVKKEGINY